jgi:rhodanese-related sulfurtransferase
MILALAFPFAVAGCSSGGGALSYEQINGAEAKALMDKESGYIIIDARTQSEYDEGHIPGAILIPEYEIAQRAESELPDKNQLILVYCRSGRRSKIAAEELVKLGYTNVKEFGGIIDWEYEIVQ